MKLILFLIIVCSGFNVNAQSNVEIALLQLNLNSVMNQPIDSLLVKIPGSSDTTMTISSGNSVFQGASLVITYTNSPYWINIRPRDVHYITVLNSNLPPYLAWPLHLLRKEKLGVLEIYNDATLIKELFYTEGTEYK